MKNIVTSVSTALLLIAITGHCRANTSELVPGPSPISYQNIGMLHNFVDRKANLRVELKPITYPQGFDIKSVVHSVSSPKLNQFGLDRVGATSFTFEKLYQDHEVGPWDALPVMTSNLACTPQPGLWIECRMADHPTTNRTILSEKSNVYWQIGMQPERAGKGIWDASGAFGIAGQLEEISNLDFYTDFYDERNEKRTSIRREIEKATISGSRTYSIRLTTYPRARMTNTTDKFEIAAFTMDKYPNRWPLLYTVTSDAPLTIYSDGGLGTGGVHAITEGAQEIAPNTQKVTIYAGATGDEIKKLNGQTLAINIGLQYL
ncbi:hypothetical protein QUQ70_000957 [Escherichia coli]|nr:hypothetical protein [Escherichia coli]